MDLRDALTRPVVVAVVAGLALVATAAAGTFAYLAFNRADRIDTLEASLAEAESAEADIQDTLEAAEARAERLEQQVASLEGQLGEAPPEPNGPEALCSARGLFPGVIFEGLPSPVDEMRVRIVRAAMACDFEGLADLALAGDPEFIFSFGGGDDPAAFWRDEEEAGNRPLEFLVKLLDLPFETIQVEAATYVWPSAAAYDDWDSVPRADQRALRAVYRGKDLAGFRQFGAYVGFRIGITESGDWIFFVAGD